jgi:hypothetical protein
VPAPATSSVSPSCRRARSRARRTQASGSTNDARSGIEAADGQQLGHQVGGHPDLLGEAAGIERGAAEAVAQRLVPALAAPARPAGRVVVDHDGLARRGRARRARRARRPRRSPRPRGRGPRAPCAPPTPRTRPTADPAGHHAADDLARPGRGSGTSSIRTSRGRDGAGDPHGASRSPTVPSVHGLGDPAVRDERAMRPAGVTSNAGLRTGVSARVRSSPPGARRTSSGIALLHHDPRAVRERGVDGAHGPGDDERDARRRRGERVGVRADLVRRVPVAGDAVAARDDGVDLPARDEPGGGPVGQEGVAGRPRARAPTRSGGRPAGAGGSRRRGSRRRRSGRPARGRTQRRAAGRAGQDARVAVGEDPRDAAGGEPVRAGLRHPRRGGVLGGVQLLGGLPGGVRARPPARRPPRGPRPRRGSRPSGGSRAGAGPRAPSPPSGPPRAPRRRRPRSRGWGPRARPGGGSPRRVGGRAQVSQTSRWGSRVWSRRSRRVPSQRRAATGSAEMAMAGRVSRVRAADGAVRAARADRGHDAAPCRGAAG